MTENGSYPVRNRSPTLEGFPVATPPRNTYSALVTALTSFTAWFLLHVWFDLCGPYFSYVSFVTYLHFNLIIYIYIPISNLS